ECDVGYTRTNSGFYLGTCERCHCNGHASSCDPETGRCLQCLHNTDGERCERCLPGFYGDPVRGGLDACKPCPCHGITSDTQFSSTCYLGSDGAPVCDSCLPGFTGRRCERYIVLSFLFTSSSLFVFLSVFLILFGGCWLFCGKMNLV
ncbi:hypothetical protein ILYODFUR_019136, partial [Ilyodon furcidens]